jgi:protein-export membrane protein SecD
MIRTKLIAIGIIGIGILLGLFVYNSQPGLGFSGNFEDAQYRFRLGLDLAGGTQLVYRADVSEIDQREVSGAMETLKRVIERRINPLGQQETNVQIQEASLINEGEHRIIIEIPGVTDVAQAKQLIGETPLLEFKIVRDDIDFESVDFETVTVDDLYESTPLTGRFLRGAQLQFNQSQMAGGFGQGPAEAVVVLQFDSEGSDLFAEITRNNIGKQVAIFLDGIPISVPTVREEITGGEAVISGNFTPESARDLAQQLSFGALPVPIEEISTQTIGASLGVQAIESGVRAGLIGLLVLALFFIAWYRLPGLVAVVALGFYGIVMFSLFKVVPVTLTAAGIAGFIISLGIAVDANVLIFERLKEEMRKGNTLNFSVREGFSRAWLSIRDSNLSSIITAVILFWFGSSLIKGFAITFGLGVFVSMISAITVTRILLLAIAGTKNGRFIRTLFASGFTK